MFSNQYERELHLHGAGATYLLENRLKQMFGKKYCLLTCSATAALEVICQCLNLSNKQVYTSPYQWPGMLVPLLNRNNELFFGQYNRHLSLSLPVSSDFEVLLIVDSFGKAHNNQHLFREYCIQNGSIYITDASSSMSTITEEGYPSGSFSDIVITSFGPQKPFFGGEGGAILTDNESWFEKMVLYTGHPYRHIAEGYSQNIFTHNLRMNPFGILYLEEKFDDYLQGIHQKQEIYFEAYQDLLNHKLLGDNTPKYTVSNTTFSPFIVEVKNNVCIPDYLKIGTSQIKPAFFFQLPSNLSKACFYGEGKGLDKLNLLSLELKDS